MNPEQAKQLREPFPPEVIGKLPKAGISLDYVGHAAVTDRLLAVDPEWVWEPVAWAEDGAPLIRYGQKEASLWIRLTVCGVTRIGVGTAPPGAFELEKQLISDALRNAAMRFGVALDLWSKEALPEVAEPVYDPMAGWQSRDEAADSHKALKARIDLLTPEAKKAIKALTPTWPMNLTDFAAVETQVMAATPDPDTEPF
jgi:hypothetical protein